MKNMFQKKSERLISFGRRFVTSLFLFSLATAVSAFEPQSAAKGKNQKAKQNVEQKKKYISKQFKIKVNFK